MVSKYRKLSVCFMVELAWLPKDTEWDVRPEALPANRHVEHWQKLLRLVDSSIDFVQIGKLGRVAQRLAMHRIPASTDLAPVELKLCGLSTLHYLIAGVRAAGLRLTTVRTHTGNQRYIV
jgi:hypothetical protein